MTVSIASENLRVMDTRPLILALALACIPACNASVQDDTLAVELMAIKDLVSAHAGGRVIVLNTHFVTPGQAPPAITTTPRPTTRQGELESAISLVSASAITDTLYVEASAPVFQGSAATVSVTVRHREKAARTGFYETVEYFVGREFGRWSIQRRTQLGIS